jgi:hypothetical protein
MHDELVKIVRDVKAENRSGLLTALVNTRSNTEQGEASLPGKDNVGFSFLFKEGKLAAVQYQSTTGSVALSNVTCIVSVSKTRWLPLSPSMVSISENQLEVNRLLQLLGDADAISPNLSRSTEPQTSLDASLKLLMRCDDVFAQVLGRDGKVALRTIQARYSPKTDRDGFLTACVAELEPLLGKDSAEEMLRG